MVLTSAQIHERILATAQDLPVRSGFKFSFRALGTLCQIQFEGTSSRVAGEQFKAAAIRWVADFESRYSRFLPDSLVSEINRAAGKDWVELDEESDRLFALCQELFFVSRGAFDPTAMPLVKLWNWKADPVVIPAHAAIDQARQLVGLNKVLRRRGAIFLPKEGMSIDLGGIGKEYAVDRVVQIAAQHGIESLLVDFGQDLAMRGTPKGKPAWHIGLEDPAQPGKCWVGLAIKNRAVATSGDYLRKFEIDGRRYGHIIDPRSGYPVNNGCRAVSVIAPTCTVAGALSTSAFILGPNEGLNLIGNFIGVDGCIITDNTRHETRKFHEIVTHS